jgi:hypothetical protein
VRAFAQAHPGGGDDPPSWAVQFVGDDDWDALRDLPWEYIGLPDADEGRDDFTPRVAVGQVFDVAKTKRGGRAAVQQVAVFSSRGGGQKGQPDPLFASTCEHLDAFSLKPDPAAAVEWNLFLGKWPEDADVVILQAPVQLRQNAVEVLFAAKDGFKPVPAKSVADSLGRRDAVTLVLLETVADECRNQPARALRRLARYLAVEIKRPVVAACHPRAYLAALDDTPGAPPFVAELLKQYAAGLPLEAAAYTARERVATSLGTGTAAIVGLPIVVRPVERDESEDTRPTRSVGR